MRIVVVTHYFPDHRGGIELVADALARRLTAESGLTLEWFASDCDPPPQAGPALVPRPMPAWNGLEKRTGLPYPLWWPGSWPVLWRAIARCDLVHIHDYLYAGSLLAWSIARLRGRPCIITQHVGNVPLGNGPLRRLLGIMNATVGRMVLRGSTRAVFVSDVVRRQFFPAAPARSMVIANGVDTSVFQPVEAARRAALRARLGCPDGTPVLLFVGRFVAKKGLPLLERLVPRLPRAHWIFAGRGPLDPGAWQAGSVQVIHDRTGPALAELYQAADLLVLPSCGEGFPLVVQESMACGTPALVGDELVGSLPDLDGVLMTEGVTGDDDEHRWQARLAALLDAPHELASRRDAVAAFARERWSWDRCAAAYAELFRDATTR